MHTLKPNRHHIYKYKNLIREQLTLHTQVGRDTAQVYIDTAQVGREIISEVITSNKQQIIICYHGYLWIITMVTYVSVRALAK